MIESTGRSTTTPEKKTTPSSGATTRVSDAAPTSIPRWPAPYAVAGAAKGRTIGCGAGTGQLHRAADRAMYGAVGKAEGRAVIPAAASATGIALTGEAARTEAPGETSTTEASTVANRITRPASRVGRAAADGDDMHRGWRGDIARRSEHP